MIARRICRWKLGSGLAKWGQRKSIMSILDKVLPSLAFWAISGWSKRGRRKVKGFLSREFFIFRVKIWRIWDLRTLSWQMKLLKIKLQSPKSQKKSKRQCPNIQLKTHHHAKPQKRQKSWPPQKITMAYMHSQRLGVKFLPSSSKHQNWSLLFLENAKMAQNKKSANTKDKS